MNKRQRFFAAVQGQPVDRPPVTAWVHFQSDHLQGRQVADLHTDFLREYDWDVLKVMNDYRYPVPTDVRSLADASSLDAYRRLSLKEPGFVAQFDCLKRIQDTVAGEVPLLETGFEPFQQIVRNIGFSQAQNLYKHRASALAALETVTEVMCEYIHAVKAMGVEGIFLSINGAMPCALSRGATDEQHETFQKPFTVEVLKAAEGMVRVLHVHGGPPLEMGRLEGYPHEVLSVSDRLPGNPSLAALRALTDKCLMGGIDETKIQERTLPEIESEIDDCLAVAGRDNFILAPGCTIASFTSRRNLRFLREYSRFPDGLPS